MIKIFQSSDRKISLEQIEYMSATTSKEENLSFRKVESLTKNIEDGNVFFAFDGDKIVGWIERYQLWEEWWGLSSLYVDPKYRDNGVGRGMLLPAAVESLNEKYIYAATTNQLVWNVLLEHGFQRTTFFQYPVGLIWKLFLLRYTNLHSLLKLAEISKKEIHYFYRQPV